MINAESDSIEKINFDAGIGIPGQKTVVGSELSLPPIAGFWRRFFAWFLDALLLGIAGQLFALVFSSYLFRIGPAGRLIGLLVVVPYYGLLNSKIGGGQTIGKRIMNIAVRNKENEPIEVWRSIVRILILWLPVLFNGWAISILKNDIMSVLVTVIVFGFGGSILYSMVFNSKTRQGIHDLLLRTYVVYLPGEPVATFPIARPIHGWISAAWIGLVAVVAILSLLIMPSLISKTPLASVMGLYEVFENDTRFFSVGVNETTYFSTNGKSSHVLVITAWCKGKPDKAEQTEMVRGIAKTVFEHEKDIDRYDALQVKLTASYDIGIATGNFTQTYANSVSSWREEYQIN